DQWSRLAIGTQPVGTDEQAIRLRRPALHQLAQLSVLLAQQMRIHQAADHRLAAEARPALEERGDGLRGAAPRRNPHLPVEPAQDALDALARRRQEPADAVVRDAE